MLLAQIFSMINPEQRTPEQWSHINNYQIIVNRINEITMIENNLRKEKESLYEIIEGKKC